MNNLDDYNKSVWADTDTELLQLNVKDEFNKEIGDIGITDITTKGNPSKYGLTGDGAYVNLKTRNKVGGYYDPNNFNYDKGSVHISPRIANSHYSDIIKFRATVGHELIHAYHNFMLYKPLEYYTERVAYEYSYNTYVSAVQFSRAFSLTINMKPEYWGYYPKNYEIPFFIP